jgi:hypothetical protein
MLFFANKEVIMTPKEWDRSTQTIKCLIDKVGTLRGFARAINEDKADIYRWKEGKAKIRTLAVINICKLYGIKPQYLRPDLFADDVVITFNKDNKKDDK